MMKHAAIRLSLRYGFMSAAFVALLSIAYPSQAADSTAAPHPAVGWQPPNARAWTASACPPGAVNNWNGSAFVCTNNIATASGLVDGATVPLADVTGTPTCSVGYALTYSGGSYSCVNSVTLAATASGIAGTPTCSVGYALTYSGGAYACVNSVALAAAAGNGVASVSGSTLTTTNGTVYTLH